MPKRKEFTKSRFILTEGFEDTAFLRALISYRANIPEFDVNPTIDLGSTAGNSGFEDAVIACEPIRGFDAVNEIVIVADNDGAPAQSFSNVTAQIEKARQDGNLKRNWGTATEPAVKADGDPSLSVWMWPSSGQNGCLESLLWQVIESKYPHDAECVQNACLCSKANTWPVSKLDKARVRCFISIHCKNNPALSLAKLWQYHPALIPLSRPEFNPISDFLRVI